MALAAIVLPVEPAVDSASGADRTRADDVMRLMRGDVRHRFEAERMPPGSTVVEDVQASAGAARSSQPSHESGYVVFGPGIELDPGSYRVYAALRLAIGEEVCDSGTVRRSGSSVGVIAFVEVPATELTSDRYSTFTLAFETDEVLRDVEFRVRAHASAELLVDYVDLVPLLP